MLVALNSSRQSGTKCKSDYNRQRTHVEKLQGARLSRNVATLISRRGGSITVG